MKSTLTSTARKITAHALAAPKNALGQKVQNTLSPHFETLTTELIRNTLIGRTQEAEAAVAKELIGFRAFLPEALYGQFDHTAALIASAIRDIYKLS